MANKQGYTILERYPVISYTLIDRGDRSYQRYVAAWILDESNPDKLTWAQGHYFCTLYEATQYIRGILTEGFNMDDFDAEFGDEVDITDTYPTGWSDYMDDYDWLRLNGGN